MTTPATGVKKEWRKVPGRLLGQLGLSAFGATQTPYINPSAAYATSPGTLGVFKGIGATLGAAVAYPAAAALAIPTALGTAAYGALSGHKWINTEIDHTNSYAFINVESMYAEDIKTKYGQTIYNTLDIVNDDVYDIYIVVTIDKNFKFQPPVQNPIPDNPSHLNPIIWKWGKEKRFFDYLNVLSDELVNQTLNDYKMTQPIDVLGKLWNDLKTAGAEEGKYPDMDALRKKLMTLDFDRSKNYVLDKSAGGGHPFNPLINTEYRTAGPINTTDGLINTAVLALQGAAVLQTGGVQAAVAEAAAPEVLRIAVEAGILARTVGGPDRPDEKQRVAVTLVVEMAKYGNNQNTTAQQIIAKAAKATKNVVQECAIYIQLLPTGAAGSINALVTRIVNSENSPLMNSLGNHGMRNRADLLRVNALFNTDLVGAYTAVPVAPPVTEILAVCDNVRGALFSAKGMGQATIGDRRPFNVEMWGRLPGTNDPANAQNLDQMTGQVNLNTQNNDFVDQLLTYVDTLLVDIKINGNVATHETIKKRMDLINKIARIRHQILKNDYSVMPFVTSYANNAGVKRNVIYTKQGSKYVVSILNMLLMFLDKYALEDYRKYPVSYLIAFIWNAYDPSVNRGIKTSLKLLKSNTINQVNSNAEQKLYFEEIKRMFGKFININMEYLKGITQYINYSATNPTGQRNNGTGLFVGPDATVAVNHDSRRDAYRQFVGEPKKKVDERREDVKEYFKKRFRSELALLAAGGAGSLNRFSGTTAANPGGNYGYANEADFLTAISQLSKRNRDMVEKVFELEHGGANPEYLVTSLQVKFNPPMLRIPSTNLSKYDKTVPLYVRFDRVVEFVYVLTHRHDDNVKKILLKLGMNGTTPLTAVPGVIYGDISADLANNIYNLTIETGIAGTSLKYNLRGGKKRSSSKSSKSKSSKSSLTKSSKTTKTKKSRK